jgi:hypothetical protein
MNRDYGRFSIYFSFRLQTQDVCVSLSILFQFNLPNFLQLKNYLQIARLLLIIDYRFFTRKYIYLFILIVALHHVCRTEA